MAALSRQGADVRIQEVNLSASLVQNSNATAAAVIVSAQGPIGPMFYSSYDRFVEDFGQANSKVSFDHYAIADYFKEGNSLWATRVVDTDATYGILACAIDTVANNYASVSSSQTNAAPSGLNLNSLFPTQSPTYTFYSNKGPGSYSSGISVEIVSQNLAQVTGLTTTPSTGGNGTLPASTYAYSVAAVNAEGLEFRASTVATQVVAAANSKIELAWTAVPGAVAYKVYGRTSGSMFLLETIGAAKLSYIDTGALTPDNTKAPKTTTAAITAWSNKFQIRVYDAAVSVNTPVEAFDVTQTDAVDEQGLNSEAAQRVNSFSKYIRVLSNMAGLLTVPPQQSMAKTSFPAGSSGSAPMAARITAAWQRFRNKEIYVIDSLINAGRTTPAVQLAMDSLAQSRSDCVAFLDVPAAQQAAQDARDYRNVTLNLNSTYSALFCSDLYELDSNSGKMLYVPPSGAMAGLLARTTRVAQPWFSMAGLNRGLLGVLDVRNKYDDGESTLLANSQVNYMRKFLGQGIPLWEQFTLSAQASALQFLNVRVLCNIMKRTMYSYLLYALQEPGDDILRRQIKYGLEEYLRYVQGARGIKSFTVVCNNTNNTGALVNSGTLAVAVYIVPILGVRQINLTLLVGKEGLQISETDIANLSA